MPIVHSLVAESIFLIIFDIQGCKETSCFENGWIFRNWKQPLTRSFRSRTLLLKHLMLTHSGSVEELGKAGIKEDQGNLTQIKSSNGGWSKGQVQVRKGLQRADGSKKIYRRRLNAQMILVTSKPPVVSWDKGFIWGGELKRRKVFDACSRLHHYHCGATHQRSPNPP